MNDYEHHLRTRRPFTDTSDLDAAGQFKAYFRGPRIKVEGPMGTRFGRVGMTTGEQPAFLLIHRASDLGSWDVLGPADKITGIQQTERGRYRLVPARPQPAADDDGWWWQP